MALAAGESRHVWSGVVSTSYLLKQPLPRTHVHMNRLLLFIVFLNKNCLSSLTSWDKGFYSWGLKYISWRHGLVIESRSNNICNRSFTLYIAVLRQDDGTSLEQDNEKTVSRKRTPQHRRPVHKSLPICAFVKPFRRSSAAATILYAVDLEWCCMNNEMIMSSCCCSKNYEQFTGRSADVVA